MSRLVCVTLALGTMGCGVDVPPGVDPGTDMDASPPGTDAVLPFDCKGATGGQPAAGLPPQEDPPALHAYLSSRSYGDWAAIPEPQMAVGPHGEFDRVFVNPTLEAAMAAGGEGEFPVGSATVNEIYDMNCQLRGWAVAVKIGQNGRPPNNNTFTDAGWYWYETLNLTDPTRFVASGKRSEQTARACFDCHDGWDDGPDRVSVNRDYLWTRSIP